MTRRSAYRLAWTRLHGVASIARSARAGFGIVWAAAPRELQIMLALQAVAAVGSALQLAAGKWLLDRMTGPAPFNSLSNAGAPLAALALATLVTVTATAVANERQRLLIELIRHDLEQRIIRVVAGVELEELDDPGFHDRLRRAEYAFSDSPYDIVYGIIAAIGAGLGLVAVAVAIVPVNPWLVPLTLVLSLPLASVTSRNSRVLYQRYRELTVHDRSRGALWEVLTTPRAAAEVRLFSAEHFLLPRYVRLSGERVRTVRALTAERTRRVVTVQAVVTVTGILLFAGLIALAVSGRMSVSDAGVSALALLQILQRLRAANGSAASIHESSLFLGDLLQFLRTPTRDTDGATHPAAGHGEKLFLNDVHFTYPGTNREILRNVNVQVVRGEVVALIGPNGAGKSTLVKVLCGLYEPTSGKAGFVDCNGRTELGREARRSQVTAVFQDFVRYPLTAHDNIAVADHSRIADRGRVAESARRAGIADVIGSLPKEFDTLLSRSFTGGTELSAGQWQRVALARALFRDAPFIILDEPTAAADAANERKFLEQLRSTCADRGVLLITHRMSTARRADRTYVLRDGAIVESGTHAELSARNGLYTELTRLYHGI